MLEVMLRLPLVSLSLAVEEEEWWEERNLSALASPSWSSLTGLVEFLALFSRKWNKEGKNIKSLGEI